MSAEYAPSIAGLERVLSCHMGNFSGSFPPNSLEAISECVSERAARIEIDVRFLSDDSMLVFHDATLDAETDGFGPVEALTRSRVPRLRFSSNERIRLAMLEDVVDVLRSSTASLQVDLKQIRPLTQSRVDALAAALAPLGERALIGSMAHWNVRRLAGKGFTLAIDPTLQWHAMARPSSPMLPSRRGLHGIYDDAPLAHMPGVTVAEYVESRILDINGLLPGCHEWMVDIDTLEAFAAAGVSLPLVLREHGVGLAAWTVREQLPGAARELTWRLVELGVSAIITDNPRELAGYLAAYPAAQSLTT